MAKNIERRYRVTVREDLRSTYEVSARTAVDARRQVLRMLAESALAIEPVTRSTHNPQVQKARLAAETLVDLVNELRPRGRPDECWPWRGTINRNGYGQVRRDQRTHLAHRLVYEMEVGPIPPGLQVCHTCDNTLCSNPHHLFTGTISENQADKVSKGRQARGESNRGGGKLTEASVRDIRRLAGTEAERRLRSKGRRKVQTYDEIGRQFGVSGVMVGKIVRGEMWRHVE